MYRYGILPQLVVLVAFSELGQIDMLEGSDNKANVLGCDRCSTDKRRGFLCWIQRVHDLSPSV